MQLLEALSELAWTVITLGLSLLATVFVGGLLNSFPPTDLVCLLPSIFVVSAKDGVCRVSLLTDILEALTFFCVASAILWWRWAKFLGSGA